MRAIPPIWARSGRLNVMFVGSQMWLDNCCPPAPADGLNCATVLTAGACALELPAGFRAEVTVVFDPWAITPEELLALPGVTIGVLVKVPADDVTPLPADGLDRVVSFRPDLSGTAVLGATVWRAIPPPVSDALFADVRRSHSSPRAMSVGRSTGHRERMLIPAKHHHDLLQVIHGVSGPSMIELLREYDVGVYVPSEVGGDFGPQVGMHLAAGQLLLSDTLAPAHGLERNIDYLHVGSPEELVWVLERLGRFPEMHQRIRVRGRLKAEQYRASRLFGRLAHDALADVAAFGSDRVST